MSVQVVAEFEEVKADLEGRVAKLEEERGTLINDIEVLREAITVKTLERNASHLEGEVESLRSQKLELENRLREFSILGDSSAQ